MHDQEQEKPTFSPAFCYLIGLNADRGVSKSIASLYHDDDDDESNRAAMCYLLSACVSALLLGMWQGIMAQGMDTN